MEIVKGDEGPTRLAKGALPTFILLSIISLKLCKAN